MLVKVNDFIRPLPVDHQRALTWFLDNLGKEVPWPPSLEDGTLLAGAMMGIFKPKWSGYVLSVKQTLAGAYPDQEPLVGPNGTWLYAYHQQGMDPQERDEFYANKAFMLNVRDKVPVGVLFQTSPKGRNGVRYRVAIALPVAWSEGFFLLQGASQDGTVDLDEERTALGLQLEVLKNNEARLVETMGSFDPDSIADGRKRTLRAIVLRQGQTAFRQKLLAAYGGRCAITGSDCQETLEAAHIVPYAGVETNHVSNGLLLRSDIHTLWDLGLIALDTRSMRVILHPNLMETRYNEIAGRPLRLPLQAQNSPSELALEAHRQWTGL